MSSNKCCGFLYYLSKLPCNGGDGGAVAPASRRGDVKESSVMMCVVRGKINVGHLKRYSFEEAHRRRAWRGGARWWLACKNQYHRVVVAKRHRQWLCLWYCM